MRGCIMKQNNVIKHYITSIIGLLVIYLFNLQSALVFAQSVNLAWTPSSSSNLSHYNIYRANHIDSCIILIETINHPDSTYIDDDVQVDSHYYYVVTAVDLSGNESGFSNMVDTTISSEFASITGNIYYCLNKDPVEDVIVPASTRSYIDTTDLNGDYELLDLPTDNYVVKPIKENNLGISSAISAFDAAWILQYIVGLRTFESCQMISADVSGDGRVSVVDVVMILLWNVGIITHFPVMQDSTYYWTFVPDDFALTKSNWMIAPDSIAYTPLNSNEIDDYKAILYGDVSGNWHPNDNGLAKSVGTNAKIRLQDVYGEAGDKISLPVHLDNGSDIIAISFTLTYDSRVLKAVGASLTPLTKDFHLAHGIDEGRIKIALAGSLPIDGSGSVVNLEFEVLDGETPNPGSFMQIIEILINDSRLSTSTPTSEFKKGILLPKEHALQQNFPNPFNTETMIQYQLPKSCKVVLKIYNTIGQEVRTLVNNEEKEAGYHKVVWNGKDNGGIQLPSGVYVYRIEAGEFVDIKKLIFVK